MTLMSDHITQVLSSCSVAQPLSIFVWGMSHIQSFSEHRPQVNEQTINSPTLMLLMTHWTPLQSLGTYWHTEDKGKLSLPQLWKHPGIVTSFFLAFKIKALFRHDFPNWLFFFFKRKTKYLPLPKVEQLRGSGSQTD